MTGTLLSLGHGYVARTLAQRLGAGWRVIGTTRSPDKAEALRAEGVEPLIWPGAADAQGTRAELSDALRGAMGDATHILASAAPVDGSDPLLAHMGDALQHSHAGWVGYLSTTGVYGDHAGGWVSERTPLTPSTRRGAARVAAEAQWDAACSAAGLPLHIFRLAGIYGPGRGPFERLRRGEARRVIKPGQVFSRIHVEDIAQVLAASMAAPHAGAIYNVCDDEPAPPQDVVSHAATLLGVPQPPELQFEQADMTPMGRSFYAESKRVRNARIKQELGVTLKYPTYREGLAAVLDEERPA